MQTTKRILTGLAILLLSYSISVVMFTAIAEEARAENTTQIEIFTDRVNDNQQRSISNETIVEVLREKCAKLQRDLATAVESEKILSSKCKVLETQMKANQADNEATLDMLLNHQRSLTVAFEALMAELYDDYELSIETKF